VVSALHELHSMAKRGPMPHSLFLEDILRVSGVCETTTAERLATARGLDLSTAALLEATGGADAGVPDLTAAPANWNWSLIFSALRWPDSSPGLALMESAATRTFIQRLAQFFTPAKNTFPKVELTSPTARPIARAGCQLVEFLAKRRLDGVKEAGPYLDELLAAIKSHLQSPFSSDAIFSPTRLATTASQYYFLFLGRLSRTTEGRQALDDCGFIST